MIECSPGEVFTGTSGKSVTIVEHVGSGGQGGVYLVEGEGQRFALKLYHPGFGETADGRDQEKALREVIIPRPPPSPAFVWPLDFVPWSESRSFGYLMPLLSDRFVSFEKYQVGNMPSPSFRALCTVALNLTECFRLLHVQGFCYKDISFGNVQFDPENGDIAVLDNDNVRVDGAHAPIIGTTWFMAPELHVKPRGEPSSFTDRYSLAVLLFFLLVRHHPLNGKSMASYNVFTERACEKAYSKEAVFVFDPHDASNRPVPGMHDLAYKCWDWIPEFLQNEFVRAFTDGLRDPGKRILEGEWGRAFSRLRDQIMVCPSCGASNFSNPAKRKGGLQPCRHCGKLVPHAPRIKIDDRIIVLTPGTSIYPHHMGIDLDFSAPIAVVRTAPKDPNTLALKNLSRDNWTVSFPDKPETKPVEPQASVKLRDKIKIHFGKSAGTVHFPK